MLTEGQLGQLDNLKRDRGSDWEKPYKPALVLALMDLGSIYFDVRPLLFRS
jgi:hypothetical protein